MSEQVNYLSDLKVKNLEAESILIKSKDGLSQISMNSFENGVGLWLTKGDFGVTMYSIPGQEAVIAAYNLKNHKGHQLAFCVDKDGNPQIQVIVNGEFKNIDLSKLP